MTSSWQLESIVADLKAARRDWRALAGRKPEVGGRDLPSRTALAEILEGLIGALFPLRLGPADLQADNEDAFVAQCLQQALDQLLHQVRLELGYHARHGEEGAAALEAAALRIVSGLADALPQMRRALDLDVVAAYEGDPAARSFDEVLLCYPGVQAMIYHRLAHYLYQADLPILSRIGAELAHSATGIDIHPGARIGRSFFIDHGTGVVIGETAIIGDHVRIYQQVTLGAKRFTLDERGQLRKGEPRHPIVEDGVVIYAGATILGRVTIGKGSVIGGNVWVTRSVPPGSHLTQASARQGEVTDAGAQVAVKPGE